MGYLFEHMEKMDIQAERRNTAEARKAAEEAKARADQAEERAAKAVAQAEAKVARAKEETMQMMIETYCELGVLRERVLLNMQEKFNLTEEEAAAKLELYWKRR